MAVKLKKLTAKVLSVSNCAGCPFSSDGAGYDDVWTCTAVEDARGHFRKIEKIQTRRGVWAPPPKWCPLRAQVVVVALEGAR